MTTAKAPIVIIGSGLAGYNVAREVRKRDRQAPILLVSAERGDFYYKPGLSTALAQGKTAAMLVGTPADEMARSLELTLVADTETTALDLERQRILTSRGEFDYGKLVLALGADPIVLPIGGDGAADCLSVNDLAGYAVWRTQLAPARRVAVMGAGLIGCEFANDLLHAGMTPVVIDPNPLPLATLIPPTAGQALRDALAAAGVQWRLGAAVSTIERVASGLCLKLTDDRMVVADLVLSAVGLRPRTGLARACGLSVGRGILVDEFGQTSAQNVFAIGDCAEYSAGVLPFVQPIMVAARQLAQTLTDAPSAIRFGPMPVIVKTSMHPVVVLNPPPATAGAWGTEPSEDGVVLWFKTLAGQTRGFVLTGAATQRRAEAMKRLDA